MLLSFKDHCLHSVAALVLFAWLAAMFINVAQACLASPAPSQTAYSAPPIHVIEHEACVNEDSGHHPVACKPHCDAQARDVVKAKSFDPAGVDRAVRFSYVPFSPWNPDGGIVVNTFPDKSPLYDQNVFLRFARLTL